MTAMVASTERRAFLEAISAAPADDLPRLVYADWLEDTAEPRDPERAEFIRAQCGEYKLVHTHTYGHPGGCRKCKLKRRACRWIEREGKKEFALWLGQITTDGIWYGGQELLTNGVRITYHRGVVERVRCKLINWIGRHCPRCSGEGCSAHGVAANGPCLQTTGIGPRVLAAHPVALVSVTDRAPTADGNGFWQWNTYSLPAAVFNAGHEHLCQVHFTSQDADNALSAALIDWAKKRNLTP